MVNSGVYGLFLVCFMSIVFLIRKTFSSALLPSCLLHKHHFCDPSCFQGLPVLRPSRHREDPGSQSAGQRVQPGGKKGGLLHEERSGLPQQVGGRIRETAAAAVRSGKPELFKWHSLFIIVYLINNQLEKKTLTSNLSCIIWLNKASLSPTVMKSWWLFLFLFQAYQMRPSIIFFDEIDGLAPVRSSRQDQIHRFGFFFWSSCSFEWNQNIKLDATPYPAVSTLLYKERN